MSDRDGSEALSPSEAALEARLSEPVFRGYRGLDRAQVLVSAFLIAAAGMAVYWNAFRLPFHTEDQLAIQDNVALHRLWTISQGWDSYGVRPFTAVTLALDWGLGGGDRLFFRLTNVALHIASGILVYLLARRLVGRGAPEAVPMLAGLLFVSHPATTQAMNYVSERSALLAAVLSLSALLLYARATDDPRSIRPVWFCLGVTLFGLAWASDVSVWVLPILLVLFEWAAGREGGVRGRWWAIGVFWAAGAGLIAVHVISGKGVSELPGLSGLLGQARLFGQSLWLMVYPAALSVDHAPVGGGLGVPWLWVGALAGSAVLAVVAPPLGLALSWLTMTFAGRGVFAPDAALHEQRLYYPLIGPALMAPWAIGLVPKGAARAWAGAAAGAVVVGLGVLTFLRNEAWQSEPALWQEADELCPACAEPPARQGRLHLEAGETALERAAVIQAEDPAAAAQLRQEAATHFTNAEGILLVAVQYQAAKPEAWLHYGTAQRYLGKLEEARATLETALARMPTSQAAFLQLAMLHDRRAIETGEPADRRRALDYYEGAARLGRIPPEVVLRYGAFLARLGDYAQGAAVLGGLAGTELGPRAEQELARLETQRTALERLQREAEELAATPAVDPISLRLFSVQQLILSGDYFRAAYLIESVFRERGPRLDVWYLLGLCKAKTGSIGQFLADWPEPPEGAEAGAAWAEVARRAVFENAWDAAVAIYEARLMPGQGAAGYVAVAELALSAGNTEQAAALLRRGAEAYPGDPAPWLRLCDLALDAGQMDSARQLYFEAADRNAPDDQLASRRERLGIQPGDRRPVRTIIPR